MNVTGMTIADLHDLADLAVEVAPRWTLTRTRHGYVAVRQPYEKVLIPIRRETVDALRDALREAESPAL